MEGKLLFLRVCNGYIFGNLPKVDQRLYGTDVTFLVTLKTIEKKQKNKKTVVSRYHRKYM